MKTKQKPTVSLIVLTWNGLEHLKDCLPSITKQTYKDFETIVVDNGSTDGSIEYIKNNFPKFKLIENGKNLGFCKANNKGVHASKGKYVVFLNNDTELDKDFVKELVEYAEKADDNVGMLSCKMIFFNKRDHINSIGLKMFDDGTSIDDAFDVKDKGYDKPQEVFGPCGGAAFFKREALDSIKMGNDYFDSDFFIYADDSDLAFRLRLNGWKCMYVPKAKIYHKFRATCGQISDFGVYHGTKNKLYLIIKDYPLSLLIQKFPKIFFRQLISMGYYLTKGKKAAFKARLTFIKNIPKMLGKRKTIQKNKTIKTKEIKKEINNKNWI